MKSQRIFAYLLTPTLCVFLILWGTQAFSQPEKSAAKGGIAAKGERLVKTAGCADCHSPKLFTEKGPQPDPNRFLAGSPADFKLPEVPAGLIAPNKWGAVTTNDMTAWVGPWGVSFAANLTPDKETGIGSWTKEMFRTTIRSGKIHTGARDILPPMPWAGYANFNDAELDAIFDYLMSLKPISNQVPQPIPPKGGGH